MKDVHSAMMRILTAAMPAIAGLEWSSYGARLRLHAGGVRKYQGLLLRTQGPLLTDKFDSSPCGVLRDRESSEVVVARKIAMLRSNPKCTASIEVRNPEVGDWGGGHVFLTPSGQVRGYSALSGAPEIGDHLILPHLALMCNVMTRDEWSWAIDCEHPGVAHAMSHVDMSKKQYTKLVLALLAVITDAAEPL